MPDVATSPAPPILAPPILATIETACIDEAGILRVAGWAASQSTLAQLRVFVGERPLGQAQCHLPRDDVAARHPDYPNAPIAGFLLQQEATETDLAQEAVHVIALAADGVGRAFSASLARPQRLRRPPAESVARLGCEEMLLTAAGHLAIRGWAVCSSGVAAVEVELDGAAVGIAQLGQDRPDIGNRYPRVPAARQAGFFLEQERGRGFAGDHVLRLTLRGQAGELATLLQTVSARAGGETLVDRQSGAPAAAIRCHLDAPALQDGVASQTVRGFMSLNGWAFGPHPIARIEVFVDGRSQGLAHHGIRREDLQAAYPGHDALLAGFATVVPPHVMRPGMHEVRIVVHDAVGGSRTIDFSVRAGKPASGAGPWMLRYKLPQAEIDLQHAILRARGHWPCWTVVLLAGAADARALAITLESLRMQAYEGWRVVILTRDAETAARLARHDLPEQASVVALQPDRLLADCVEDTGSVGNTGAVLLAPGDQLGEDALLELAVAGALDPAADFLYADERRIDPSDGEAKAFFKPDFSPDLLLSTNYIGRPWAASTGLLRRAGLRQGELQACGHYDAVLRLTEQARRIGHVAKVLCARGGRGEARGLERRALQRAMRRRAIAGRLLGGPVGGSYRLRRAVDPRGRVSIIIPTSGARGLIRTAIASIRAHTAWPDIEIICLDHIPSDGTPEQLACKRWIAAHADRTIEILSSDTNRRNRTPFNWSRFNNLGARAASGDYLLFLNDDIEVRENTWLHGLLEHAQRPEVGVVGPQLLYPDGRVQHAGMFLARHAARHAFRFYRADEPGPFGLALTQREVISVTGACMMMRRAVFDELGGFDERHAVINNDLDFNLRVRAAGHRVVFTPAVSLVHHEMVSRAGLADSHDANTFARDWGDLFARGDPFFSPHFSPDADDHLPDAEPVRCFTAGHPLIAREKIRRILAVKVDHIGDFITALPAFARIKRRFPGAELTVLAARASLALAPLEPAIDAMIEFNFYHARSEKGRRAVGRRALAALRHRLAGERFDLAIDLRRQPDSRPILQATGARWLAGFDDANRHPWLDIAVAFEGDIALRRKRAHVSDSLAGLVDAVSAQCETDRRLVAAPPGRALARRHLAGRFRELADDGAFACVHTGAGALNKQWPAASFTALIDLLADEGVRVAVIGGPGEAAFAHGVVARAKRRQAVVNLVGRTGLADLPGVLAAADLYVGNDSGPKHIAAALGVPTIGIHGGSVDGVEWGAVGPYALTIRRDMTCSPCYLARAADCPRGLACLDGIRVGDVFAACMRMLALRLAPLEGIP